MRIGINLEGVAFNLRPDVKINTDDLHCLLDAINLTPGCWQGLQKLRTEGHQLLAFCLRTGREFEALWQLSLMNGLNLPILGLRTTEHEQDFVNKLDIYIGVCPKRTKSLIGHVKKIFLLTESPNQSVIAPAGVAKVAGWTELCQAIADYKIAKHSHLAA